MHHALTLAKKAQHLGEVPVGAVIVQDDILIGEGWNQPISSHDPTAHAEIRAIRTACNKNNNYRLPNTTLYVTLEPCLMCAGAIIHSRIARVVFAAKEPKAGAGGSGFDLFNDSKLNHHVHCEQGLLSEQSSLLLRQFFKARR
ncbi:UNVERIFIED_CONTAM: hypothetical protein GTU68_027472 [Idotea baltica]|nr:hypothetical protein [Idotea baltica]